MTCRKRKKKFLKDLNKFLSEQNISYIPSLEITWTVPLTHRGTWAWVCEKTTYEETTTSISYSMYRFNPKSFSMRQVLPSSLGQMRKLMVWGGWPHGLQSHCLNKVCLNCKAFLFLLHYVAAANPTLISSGCHPFN